MKVTASTKLGRRALLVKQGCINKINISRPRNTPDHLQ